MVKVIIIEDESAARNKLRRFIETLDQGISIVNELTTLDEVESFFSEETKVDLIFSDIELRDGNVFEVLKNYDVEIPIIFTTAYNQFWMNAFETSGIEYLLKPFDYSRFEKAWNKYRKLISDNQTKSPLLAELKDLLAGGSVNAKESFKTRFSFRSGNDLGFINVSDIKYFEVDNGVIFIHSKDSRKVISTYSTLAELYESLDPEQFFQINRSEIVSKSYIESIQRFTKNIIAIKLYGAKEFLKTSQSKTSEFYSWVEA
ncbi:LytR/AlgR family response regulator transcription factor [Marinigracilibium pacificum]|uniref:Response regulator transcription factor n=1 Tax=Marinigracilibium pacificum TaxID=2729599 RepID=A0A848J5X2_9BACT|nr:LytTR family DNA-binding domain-containing protein [Marinigracilibium pacificum]NMM49769.1 response regulator transcription factor [Marinigracilibium pacificum]